MKRSQSKMFVLFVVAAIAALLLAACGAAPAPVQKVSEPVHSHEELQETTLNPTESMSHVEVLDFVQTANKNKKMDPLVFQQQWRSGYGHPI